MLQRKNAIENGGTLPATPRARIMLETCAVATSRKPTSPSTSRALLAASLGSIMFNPVLASLPTTHHPIPPTYRQLKLDACVAGPLPFQVVRRG